MVVQHQIVAVPAVQCGINVVDVSHSSREQTENGESEEVWITVSYRKMLSIP